MATTYIIIDGDRKTTESWLLLLMKRVKTLESEIDYLRKVVDGNVTNST